MGRVYLTAPNCAVQPYWSTNLVGTHPVTLHTTTNADKQEHSTRLFAEANVNTDYSTQLTHHHQKQHQKITLRAEKQKSTALASSRHNKIQTLHRQGISSAE